MIPYGRQEITDADVEAVVEVLRSDFLTQGPVVPRFEQAVAACCGAGHGVAFNSATSALHIACLALDLKPGDWLWTSPNTFVASANCGRYCGARVDFVDIDPRTHNLSAEALAAKLECAERLGKLPKIVIPVHFAGQPCEMATIAKLAQRYGFRVIEDASHAIGARYRDEPVGNCRYSDITVFSFHPVKIITTGEGGLATTNDASLTARMSRLRSHGVTRDSSLMVGPSDGDWYYQQVELGYNYRMTDIQAALGLSQLQRLAAYVERRQLVAHRYDEKLRDLPVFRPYRDPEQLSAMHLYPILLRDDAGKERSAVFNALRKAGVGVNVHYIPVHTQPDYQRFGFKLGDFPVAESYYRAAISIPLYSAITECEENTVVESLRQALM